MHRWIVAVAACGLLLAGCGSEDDEPAAAKAGPVAAAAKTYTPTSDVSSNAAIGKDLAAIRAVLEPEGAGAKPDFAAAAEIWSKGQNSNKSDGTKRTLAGFVEKHPAGTGVADALAGRASAADLTDGQRAEWIDKGMVVALGVHALSEFDGAKEKLAAGELDPQEGAVHNVDEVWATSTPRAMASARPPPSARRTSGSTRRRSATTSSLQSRRRATPSRPRTPPRSTRRRRRRAARSTGSSRWRSRSTPSKARRMRRRVRRGSPSPGVSPGSSATPTPKTVQGAFAAKAAPTGAAKMVADTLDAAADKLGFAGPLPAYPTS